MQSRINAYQIAPEVVQNARKLNESIEGLGLDKRLLELIKIRASMTNGCANCINMHTADARKLGMSEARIYLIAAWRESTVFDAKERAVLAWVDSLTQVAQHGAPDALYEELTKHFTPNEIVAINAATAMINFWNRVAIGFGTVHPSEKDIKS